MSVTGSASRWSVARHLRVPCHPAAPIGPAPPRPAPPLHRTPRLAVLLQFKRAFDRDGRLGSWRPGTSHCRWLGVTCDAASNVVGLDLQSQKLGGQLVEVDLSKLSKLRIL